jgi:hypothetical protein
MNCYYLDNPLNNQSCHSLYVHDYKSFELGCGLTNYSFNLVDIYIGSYKLQNITYSNNNYEPEFNLFHGIIISFFVFSLIGIIFNIIEMILTCLAYLSVWILYAFLELLKLIRHVYLGF